MKSKKLFIILLLLVVCTLFNIHFALAAYEIEVSIPGGEAKAGTEITLADYIRYLYLFGLSLVGIAALGALVYGGFQYMLSDTITTKEEAKKLIWGAIFGLILGLSAYLILYTINPDLVNLREPTLPESTEPTTPSPFQGGSPGGTGAGGEF